MLKYLSSLRYKILPNFLNLTALTLNLHKRYN